MGSASKHPAGGRGDAGEDPDDDYLGESHPLPSTFFEGPDEHGFIRTISYYLKADGSRVKVTATSRAWKLSSAAAERRSWLKFGDAAADGDTSPLTTVSPVNVFLELRDRGVPVYHLDHRASDGKPVHAETYTDENGLPKIPAGQGSWAKAGATTDEALGEEEEEDEGRRELGADEDSVLPPRVVIRPDENQDANTVKVVTTRTRVGKVSKAVAERRLWPKFGDAAADGDTSPLTTVSPVDVFLELRDRTVPVYHLDHRASAGNAGLAHAEKYYTGFPDDAKKLVTNSSFPRLLAGHCFCAKSDATTDDVMGKKEERHGELGGSLAQVLVRNLPRTADEEDIRRLFGKFGNVVSLQIAVSRRTKIGMGFAFVTFLHQDQAQAAIDGLDGVRFGSLILSAEWA
ncbi:hypothetical protein VPH35_118378 [Triticum aestivum]|uniref:RRM domain-containing protein n=1 Tax=Aegilops tauschii subsp. strangulata TaxID=200361 RepID=A0A453PP41_AEGTS|nr:eukaryotic translation initiation factor 3 subunit G-like [Aegilops tauschii subsp. strangulata]